MLRRLVSLLLLLWVLGFILFAVTLPAPAADSGASAKSDGIVVLTGAEGRIPRALNLLHAGLARRVLVSGVDPQVRATEFAARYKVAGATMRCCVTLGYDSVDTRSNAREATAWIAQNHVTSVRLVTSDWHMRRAAWELRRALPLGVSLIEDAVPTSPSFNTLFIEYNKLIARYGLRGVYRWIRK